MPAQVLEKINSALPLDESIELHEKGRLVQQICIVAIFLLMVSAALGLFGNGILSDKTITAGGNTMKYEKFGRHGGETILVFNLVSKDSIALITIPSIYLDYFRIETIVPEPGSNMIAGNSLIYTFNGRDVQRISFYMTPIKAGGIEGTIKGNQSNFTFSQFIYP